MAIRWISFLDKHLMCLNGFTMSWNSLELCIDSVSNIFENHIFFLRVLKMSHNRFEQQCATQFCFKVGYSATETFQKLHRAYEDNVFSRVMQVLSWFKKFSEGKELIENEPRSGRPSTEKIIVGQL